MRVHGEAAGGETGLLRGRLARLMAARLVLALAVFALALALVGAGRQGAELATRGLYGALTLVFLSTAVCAALLPRVRRVHRLGAAQVATDVVTVTAILFFTEGPRSIFSFLYLPITVYAAMLFERRGAYATALAASACTAGMLALGFLGSFGLGEAPVSFAWALSVWGVHTGALLLVAMLASTLARERRIADDRLATSASDLRELRNLHERTVDSLTSGLVTLDAAGIVISCNPEAGRILELPVHAIRGRPLETLMPGVTALIERGIPGRVRSRLMVALANGGQRFLGVAASVLRDEYGAAAGTVVIFQDVTSVVAMEQALRQRERLAAVGELAAGVAHEVRNPLAAISGCVEMLRALNRERSGDSEQERLMSIVLREIERLDALISDFLQFARPAAPKLEPLALAPLFAEIAEMCRAACPVGITVSCSAPEGLCVPADATQLRQVLWNLVRNAVQALGERGTIRMSAAVAPKGLPQASAAESRSDADGEDAVEILVADDGPGIAPEVVERIFDPFFTTKPSGTGLGLATVHRIVTAHRGAVHVVSAPGQGATFRVLLPARGETS